MAELSPFIIADLLSRSRSAIEVSRASILRSRERIGASLQIVAKPPNFVGVPALPPTDEFGEAAEFRAAVAEQRQIDREVRQSFWGDRAMPAGRLRAVAGG